jgi:hypothetical protein
MSPDLAICPQISVGFQLNVSPDFPAVYTQLTNVENERNGLLTYDRAVIQVDVDKVASANRGQ